MCVSGVDVSLKDRVGFLNQGGCVIWRHSGHGTLEGLQAHLPIMINYLTAAYLTAAYLTAAYLTAAYLTAAYLTAAYLTAAYLTAAYLTAAYLTAAYLTADCPSPPHTLIVVICRIRISACIRPLWGFLSFVVLMLTDCFHSSFAVM